ncbi:hypothetical protein Glove_417g25 [Diversispora epigaea]|uniref:Uncharacterized protein n=1 Tax=Diversispora epigaea TaxID=1348612 RepID=A0A397H4E1_9GLOM|nr:hypothetical protein Glove_417g25 [Diversispora epigaea]
MEKKTIGNMAQQILQNKLSMRDIRIEAYALVLLTKNTNTGSSRLSCLRRELKNLGILPAIVEITKFPDIIKEANKIQKDNWKTAEDNLLESIKKRLNGYDIFTLPDLQAFADVMIMLCMHPTELIILRITDAGVIDKEIVYGLGLKIDDSSNVEVYNLINKLDIVRVIHEIKVSIPHQGPKQVKVTDVFVINSSEHVLILGQPWFKDNAMKMALKKFNKDSDSQLSEKPIKSRSLLARLAKDDIIAILYAKELKGEFKKVLEWYPKV